VSDKPSFFSELKRRNVYKVAAAYIVVAWLLIQAAPISARINELNVYARRQGADRAWQVVVASAVLSGPLDSCAGTAHSTTQGIWRELFGIDWEERP
jgi:hypothetical protein